MMQDASSLTSASAATPPTHDATLILDEVLDEILDGVDGDDGFAPDYPTPTPTSVPGPSISISPLFFHNENHHPLSPPSTSPPQDPTESDKEPDSGNNDEDDDNDDDDNVNDEDNVNDGDEDLDIDTGMHDDGGGGGSVYYHSMDNEHSALLASQSDPSEFDIEFSIQQETLTPLEQQLQDADQILNNDELNTNHPMIHSNPNPMSLGPENLGVLEFLRHWIWQGQRSIPRAIARIPYPREVRNLAKQSPRRVTYDDLMGDECDFQGINWKMLGISRNLARNRRPVIYSNYVNRQGSDQWMVSLRRSLIYNIP